MDERMAELANQAFEAVRAGQTDRLTGLLDAGLPVDIYNQNGDTLVMLAAYHGHAETVSALLARGGDANQANDKGQAPLAGAVFKAADDVVRALLDGGADPAAGQPSAIETARMFGRDDLVALFQGK